MVMCFFLSSFVRLSSDRFPPGHLWLQVIGDDVSPGIKAGGRVNWIRRTIPCVARGDSIPSDFTIDIRWVLGGMNRVV